MVKPIETIPEGVKHIHCIGIGGSGMFPLVQILPLAEDRELALLHHYRQR